MTTGQNIRAWRKHRGLTQKQLGQLCGISAAAVGSYEKGATLPKRRVVEKLAAALGVAAEKLTGDRPLCMDAQPPRAGDVLYDGVLSALEELYGAVEGRVVQGENGASRRYYVVRSAPESFVLYEQDIAAIARSARASMSPLLARIGGAGRSA